MESRNKHDEAPDINISTKGGPDKSQKGLLRLITQLGDIREEMLCLADKLSGSLRDLDPAWILL